MGKIHFLKPEDFTKRELKVRKTKNYRNLCILLTTCLVIENILLILLNK